MHTFNVTNMSSCHGNAHIQCYEHVQLSRQCTHSMLRTRPVVTAMHTFNVMNTSSCQNTHITTVQILPLSHQHTFLSFPLLMLWVCIYTLPGSQEIQGDSGSAECQGYFNHAVLFKKNGINMDLIYKIWGVLLVEKKGKEIPE